MENACWKCGNPTHHARDCQADLSSSAGVKEEIQKYVKTVNFNVAEMAIKKSKAQWDKKEQKDKIRKSAPPPVIN